MINFKAFAQRGLQPIILCTLLLVIGSGLLYWKTSGKFQSTEVFDRDDCFFRTDSHRAFRDMVLKRDENHTNTSAHPCFVLFHQPFGFNYANWLKAQDKKASIKMTRRAAARLMTVVAGSAVVALLFWTLLALGLPLARAALFSAVLACSNTMMFFASIPETYIFSAFGLVAVAFCATRRPTTAIGWWLASAVYAIGNLTSSAVQVSIWALCRYAEKGRSAVQVILIGARSVLIAIALLAGLSVVQKQIYPKTTLFFLPQSVGGQTVWLYWDNLKSPVHTGRILLQHLAVSNIVAPEPVLAPFNGKPMASIEEGSWETVKPALPIVGLWAIVLVGGIAGLCRRGSCSGPVLASLGCLLFSALFFSVFGNDRMLYSAVWTPFTVLVIAAGWETWLQERTQMAKGFAVLLGVLVIAQAVHHLRFIDKIIALVS